MESLRFSSVTILQIITPQNNLYNFDNRSFYVNLYIKSLNDSFLPKQNTSVKLEKVSIFNDVFNQQRCGLHLIVF